MNHRHAKSELPEEQTVTAWARLVRVQAQLLARVHEALKAAHLPPLAWYDVLLELHRSRESGLRQYEIGDEVLLPKHNLSRLIDRLEHEGLVERIPCPEDGRGNIVRITTQGSALLKRMWPVYGGVIHEQLESTLTANEIAALGQVLHKLSQGHAARVTAGTEYKQQADADTAATTARVDRHRLRK
jgi:DNA-binding MarR family transcriptional regulator